MARQASDPRTIVTPDAFSVDPPLLGTPLANPSRRLWALLLDVVVVFMITASTSSVWYALPFVVGFFFLTRAFQRSGATRFGKVRRFFLGCLGVFVLGVSGIVFLSVRVVQSSLEEVASDPGAFVPAGINVEIPEDMDIPGLGDVVEGITEVAVLQRTDDPEAALTAATSVARRLLATGASDDEVEGALDDLLPDEVGGTDSDDLIQDVMSRVGEDDAPEATPEEDVREDQANADVSEMDLDEALTAYADWLATGPDERDRARGRALRARVGLEVAADTIDELVDAVEDLEGDLESAEDRLREAESGFGPWIRSKLDTLGFGLGWWTMYFAILMPWMKGSTPGKKLLGIRVVRLDGQPLSWWHAFERAGGYAAGLATGLLGFAQVYWDPNRQAIHDKVAGTVVVVAGAQRVPGRWEPVVEEERQRQQGEADRARGDT
jgi:uncharacterized RDD family membrane protein YckC